MWGEYLLLLAISNNHEIGLFLDPFVKMLFRSQSDPKVHHLLDNASRPTLMKYFIQKIRQKYQIPFVGYDNLTSSEANFIRTHSFAGLAGQNFFRKMINNEMKEPTEFDYPPTPIFDQKFPLALPFHKKTKHFFPNSVRDVILPSYLIDQDLSFCDQNENKVFLSTLLSKPRSTRDFYLKYAGQDTNRNWGSMRVRSLASMSKAAFEKLSKEILNDLSHGDPWIIQESASNKVSVPDFQNKEESVDEYIKYSSFFSNAGVIGRVAHTRKFYLVHGQEDSTMSIVNYL